MIEINNLTASSIDKDFLKKVAKKVLASKKKEVTLSIALVGSERIKKLNKKYRKRNKVTDILSFGQTSAFAKASADKKKFLSFPKNGLELGEVVICPQVVKKNAKKYHTNFKKELARVLIHGILHLLGYEHEKGGAGAKKMEEEEEYCLSQI